MHLESVLFELFLVLLIIFANAFFVAAEFAIVKVRTTQIQPLADKNNKRAKITVKILSNLDAYLSASQVGITMTSLGLGWVGEPVTAKLLSPIFIWFGMTNEQTIHTLSIIVGFIFLTFLHISLGEQAPKMLAIKSPKSVSLIIAIPLNIFYITFKPIVWMLNHAANFILRLIGIQQVPDSERINSEEELRLLISEGRKSGAIDQTEHQLIEKIFEFNDKQASEIMVPRNHMIAINLEDSRDEIFQKVTEEGFSRIPVYKETIDNIVGIIYTKDLISASEHRELIALQDIIRPAFFVSSTKQIGNLLKEMQRNKVHMAVVVDEYGGVEGLVTIEDIIEEIVGEIQDEYDVDETQEVVSEKSGVYLVNPIISIENFNAKFKTSLPEDPDYQTLNGFLQKVTGHIPEVYERIDFKGMSFVITKKSGNRIMQVRVQKI
ncbi:MAG: HlyC/CorC family transporter [Ignavibacteria bacterium]|jgi:CBS domain containing-hemolysin-like protein|nr:HlyC/CorC family transporter [Ignavibacteria bacterium]